MRCVVRRLENRTTHTGNERTKRHVDLNMRVLVTTPHVPQPSVNSNMAPYTGDIVKAKVDSRVRALFHRYTPSSRAFERYYRPCPVGGEHYTTAHAGDENFESIARLVERVSDSSFVVQVGL